MSLLRTRWLAPTLLAALLGAAASPADVAAQTPTRPRASPSRPRASPPRISAPSYSRPTRNTSRPQQRWSSPSRYGRT
jgi:hypothetical protein